MERPIHWRSPHKPFTVSTEEIDIFPPPPLPTPPDSAGLLVTFAPMIGMLFVLIIASQFMKGGVAWFLFSIPMMGLSAFATWYMDRQRKQKYQVELETREIKYTSYIEAQRRQLKQYAAGIREAFRRDYPPPDAVLRYLHETKGASRRLWERMPQDEDFLMLRVGMGSVPAPFTLKFRGSDNPLDDDPLIEMARALCREFSTLHNMPVTVSLKSYRRFGIVVDDPGRRRNVANNLILQLVTFHAPSEVQLVLFCDQRDIDDWKWMRWLPHVHEQGGKRRLIAADESQRVALAQQLEHILQSRQEKDQSAVDDETLHLPIFVIIVTQPRFILESRSLMNLLDAGPAHGLFFLVLAKQERALPARVRSSIYIGNQTFLRREDASDIEQIDFDGVLTHDLRKFARLMAPIQDPALTGVAEIPSMVTLFELLDIRDVDDLYPTVASAWQDSLRRLRHLVAPLGYKAGREMLEIDLHERAHGPNGLVAGMVGAGKSELLQTLVVSFALRYHPHQLAFVLIDYKGGGMAEPFRELPHTVGIITNLQDPLLAQRAIKSLDVEMRRRQALFKEANVNHIDAYHRRMYEEHDERARTPLPYLMVIVDEFAEMKTENPDLAREFIRIARLGRALGLRLILAMQKPAGIVDSQIEANTRFRLCLRVAQVEDSRTMIRRPDAAYLKQTGRAFFQVGVNELFYEFQVAWSGAPYVPGGMSEDEVQLFEVRIDGERRPLGVPLNVLPRISMDNVPETQLEAVIRFLDTLVHEAEIEPLPKLWSDPLPEEMYLDELIPLDQYRWHAQQQIWRDEQVAIRAAVGKIDDPTNPDPAKRQRTLFVDFEEVGNVALYGVPDAGKTEFVTTCLTNLALNASPAELHMYIIDCAGGDLQVFEQLPHVGAFIVDEEKDRQIRLFRLLTRLMEERKRLFLQHRVNEWRQWNQKNPTQYLPALLLVIDNMAGFKEIYQESSQDQVIYEGIERQLIQLVREGRRFGIHVLVTAIMPTDLRLQMRSVFGWSIPLQLQDAAGYSELLGVRTLMQPAPFPGRGLVALEEGGSQRVVYEFQTALAARGSTKSERRKALEALFSSMGASPQATEAPPQPVRIIPDLLPFSDFEKDIPAPESRQKLLLPLGYELVDATVFSVDLTRQRGMLVLGAQEVGKTNLLKVSIRLLQHLYGDEIAFYIIDLQNSGLRIFEPEVDRYIDDYQDAVDFLCHLREAIQSKAMEKSVKWHVVCIDDFDARVAGLSLSDGIPQEA
nr:type VII secretion protein EssC [Ardenticatena sp.]